MGLGQRNEAAKERIFLNIAHGNIERSENGQKKYYSSLEGNLESIYGKEREFHGERANYVYMELRGDEGELYSIGFSEKSGVLLSIVNSLASCSTLSSSTSVRIETYERGGFTKVVVYADGVKLDWLQKELPPIKDVQVGGQSFKDYSQRLNFQSSLIEKVNQRLRNNKD